VMLCRRSTFSVPCPNITSSKSLGVKLSQKSPKENPRGLVCGVLSVRKVAYVAWCRQRKCIKWIVAGFGKSCGARIGHCEATTKGNWWQFDQSFETASSCLSNLSNHWAVFISVWTLSDMFPHLGQLFNLEDALVCHTYLPNMGAKH
jgi:hypothetical protein